MTTHDSPLQNPDRRTPLFFLSDLIILSRLFLDSVKEQMKDRSKEKIADLLMDELLTQLSDRGTLKKMLGEMTGLPFGPLVEDLLTEFEQIVEKYLEKSLGQAQTVPQTRLVEERESFTPSDLPSTPLPVVSDPPISEPPPATVKSELSETIIPEPEPIPPPAPPILQDSIEEKEPSAPPQAEPAVEQGGGVSDFRTRLEELARRVESEYLEKLEREGSKRKSEASKQKAEKKAAEKELHAKEHHAKEPPPAEKEQGLTRRATIEVGPGEGGRPSRIPYRVADDEYLYIHGVMLVPGGETPCEYPFMLEEKGIDGKEFAFAVDSEDLRFFLSKINQKEMSVSRKGVLLLGKSESLQLHGIHENVLNELRAHGIVLPVEFGTVARGKADLLGLAGRYREGIQDGLTRLAATQWWTVSMSVLDARIAHLFAEESEQKGERAGRERARVSYSSSSLQAKKYDVKVLEKILQKEKRLAESVHQELNSIAEQSEVQHMVGLGSGSSDDWKSILQATYLNSGSVGYQRFARAVTDLQYRHILFEPMLAVTGDVQDFSFLKK